MYRLNLDNSQNTRMNFLVNSLVASPEHYDIAIGVVEKHIREERDSSLQHMLFQRCVASLRRGFEDEFSGNKTAHLTMPNRLRLIAFRLAKAERADSEDEQNQIDALVGNYLFGMIQNMSGRTEYIAHASGHVIGVGTEEEAYRAAKQYCTEFGGTFTLEPYKSRR